MKHQLAQIDALASMQQEASLALLARHDRITTALEEKIANLRTRLYSGAIGEASDALSLSLTSGHYDNWQRWLEVEISKLNLELAQTRAQREAFVSEARVAFGRKSATQSLLDQHNNEKRAASRKRLEQEHSGG